MKKIVKKHYKFIIGLIIGIIIPPTIACASQSILSGSDISYNTGTSHGSKNNIQGAIDELYEKADSCSKTLEGTNNKCQVISGTGKEVGDEVQCGTENFYIIENNAKEIIMLAKYKIDSGKAAEKLNAFPGYTTITINDNPSNIQSADCNNSPSYLDICIEGNSLKYFNYLDEVIGLPNFEFIEIDYQTLNSLGCNLSSENIGSSINPNQFIYKGDCKNSKYNWLFMNYTIADPLEVCPPGIEHCNQFPGTFNMRDDGSIQNFEYGYDAGFRPLVKISK